MDRGAASDRDAYAEVSLDLPHRIATVALNPVWPVGSESERRRVLSRTAMHEMLHVFLHEMQVACVEFGRKQTKPGLNWLNGAEHEIIEKLLKWMFDEGALRLSVQQVRNGARKASRQRGAHRPLRVRR